jgi:hypothetical protein
MKTLLGKDSKAAYREFSDVLKFFEKVMVEGLPENIKGPRIMAITVWSPQDLAVISTLLVHTVPVPGYSEL